MRHLGFGLVILEDFAPIDGSGLETRSMWERWLLLVAPTLLPMAWGCDSPDVDEDAGADADTDRLVDSDWPADAETSFDGDVDGDIDGDIDEGEPAPHASPEPYPWDPTGSVDGSAFPLGIQTGDATARGVIVQARTDEPAVSLVVVEASDDDWIEVERYDEILPEEGFAHVVLEDLEPDHAYSVAFYTADGESRSRAARFRTTPSEASRIIRFGATSGLGGHIPWRSLSRAAEERLDFFVLTGDTIYADWGIRSGFVRKWEQALATEGLADLASSTSFVATWDDHEVANNWSYDTPGMGALVAEGLEAYQRYLPQGRGPGGTGIWRALSWGPAMDIFVLDCRGERRGDLYISVAQMEWLQEALAASTARFKVIVNSVPIADLTEMVGTIFAEDRWQGYPEQRSEILSFIAEQYITGVLWVTGDFHLGGVGLVDLEGGVAEDEWEVMTGPSGSPINPMAEYLSPTERFPSIVDTWNYTYFEADPGTGTVIVRFIDDDGDIIDEVVLRP